MFVLVAMIFIGYALITSLVIIFACIFSTRLSEQETNISEREVLQPTQIKPLPDLKTPIVSDIGSKAYELFE
jgi:hypothetical protein